MRTPAGATTPAGSPASRWCPAVTGVGVGAAAATALVHLAGATRAPSSSDGAEPWSGVHVLTAAGAALAAALLLVLTLVAWTSSARRATSRMDATLVPPDVLTTLSHEIRTPLNALLGMTEVLMTTRLDAVQRDHVEHLRRSGTLILGLVNDVLDLGAAHADQVTVEDRAFELSDVLADAVELLQVKANVKGVQLQTELDPGCPTWVRGDASRLRQVLVNLLGNAVKFTDGGLVTLEVCRAARPERPAALYFQVTDTGSGIPDDQLSRIFEPWTRVVQGRRPSPEGAGLGLTISQALVRSMGGEIVATSQEEVGSAFGFELVLPPEPVPATVATALTGRRIVLLDRQPLRAARTADQLREWGAHVALGAPHDWCASGSDVVVVREDHPDELAALGAQVRRLPTDRSALVVLTANALAVPARALQDDDLVIGASTAGSRLRTALVSLGRPRPGSPETRTADVAERPLRILLAEDDSTTRLVCATLLRRLGHDVDVVADGAAAVRAAGRVGYDLVLMDSQMPELDGTEATRVIRAHEPTDQHVRVVALTGAITPADQEAYASAGMDGLLAKPVTRARLVQALAEVPRPHRASTPVEDAGLDVVLSLPLAC